MLEGPRSPTALPADSLVMHQPSPEIGRWNHNIHYSRQLLRSVPLTAQDRARRRLWRRLAGPRAPPTRQPCCGHRSGSPLYRRCRCIGETKRNRILVGRFSVLALEPASFDVVTAVASLHHFDEETGLRRMAELLRPGGMLGIVGMARTGSLRDLAFDGPASSPPRPTGAREASGKPQLRRSWHLPTPTTGFGDCRRPPSPDGSSDVA